MSCVWPCWLSALRSSDTSACQNGVSIKCSNEHHCHAVERKIQNLRAAANAESISCVALIAPVIPVEENPSHLRLMDPPSFVRSRFKRIRSCAGTIWCIGACSPRFTSLSYCRTRLQNELPEAKDSEENKHILVDGEQFVSVSLIVH